MSNNIIQTGEQGQSFASINAFSNGNAWFVDQVISVNSADEEIRALDSLNTKTTAVLNKKEFPIAAKELTNKVFKNRQFECHPTFSLQTQLFKI